MQYIHGVTGKIFDFKICHRLWSLEKMFKDAHNELRKYSNVSPSTHMYLGTIKAIAHAYISRSLQIYDAGIVSYWANGVKLVGPVLFNDDYVDRLSRIYGMDIWIEGVSDQYLCIVVDIKKGN